MEYHWRMGCDQVRSVKEYAFKAGFNNIVVVGVRYSESTAYAGTVLCTEFLIEYYEYSFDYLITITSQFTINAHT